MKRVTNSFLISLLNIKPEDKQYKYADYKCDQEKGLSAINHRYSSKNVGKDCGSQQLWS